MPPARGMCILLAGISSTAVPSAAPLTAQTPEKVLDEITVTARQQEVDLQEAPVAVSVVSGEDFDRSQVVRLDNFNGFVPALTIAKNDGAGRVVSIRGVGWETAQNLSTQPSVLVYLDGILLANPLALGMDLGDFERIEVFRGPQGTEFGQGTTGGAINIVTRKPEGARSSGSAELGLGSYDTVRVRGSANLPIGDRLAFRGSIQKYERDGYSEIAGGALDGYDLDDADSLTGHLALRWQPHDRLSVLLSGFFQASDQHAAAQRSVYDPNPDRRRLTQDFPGVFELDNTSASATVAWETRRGAVFESRTGWQRLRKAQTVDGDRLDEAHTSVDLSGLGITSNWDVLTFWDNDSDVLTQELHLKSAGERLDWVAGAYYLHHENFNHFLEAHGPAPFTDFLPALRNPGPDTLPPFASVLGFVEARTVTRDDLALYGQATYRLNDRFAITAGGRYQDEDQLDESVQFFTLATESRVRDSHLTWKLGLDLRLAGDHLLYGLVSTGWKNGGSNPGAVNGGALQTPIVFAPEAVTSLEVGSRSTFANGRVRFNAVGFLYDYDNLQFMQEDPVPFAGGTGNIPGSEIYGLETELGWVISDRWQLDGMASWMDGRFKDEFFTLDVVDFRQALAPGVGLFTARGFATRLALATSTNLEGKKPPKLVDLSARLGATRTRVFARGSVLTARVEYVYRGEYHYRVFNNPLVDRVPAYDLVNLYFQHEPARRPLRLSLSVTNLFDADGVNSRFSNPFGLLTTSEELIPPREILGTIRYSWN